MAEPSKLPDSVERMIREVDAKERRILEARERKDGFWDSLSLLGVVGWSVTLPTLAGVVAGVWLDDRYPHRFSWALTLMFAGLLFGCVNAWVHLSRKRK